MMIMVAVLTKPSSSKRLVTTGVLCLCLFFAVATQAQQQAVSGADEDTASYTKFDVSAAGKGAYEGTYGLSINTAGTITGYYIDSKFAYHGFVRTRSGTITTFDAPGAGTEAYDGTYPFSINTAGEIAGWYTDNAGLNHGFVRATNGKITTFEVPGAGTAALQGTGGMQYGPFTINTAGSIAGYYADSKYAYHGFIRSNTGTTTTFEAPGSGMVNGEGTFGLGLNTAGEVAGTEIDAKNIYHGMVRASNGKITAFNAPGAGTGQFQGTVGVSINTAGEISGVYLDSKKVCHGFVRAASGKITTFNAPTGGKALHPYQGTVPVSINTAGTITGTYLDNISLYHGFVRAADGTITTFEATGAGKTGFQGTGAVSINSAGDIAGFYRDASNVTHGFVRTP
jgi:predicted membrane protein